MTRKSHHFCLRGPANRAQPTKFNQEKTELTCSEFLDHDVQKPEEWGTCNLSGQQSILIGTQAHQNWNTNSLTYTSAEPSIAQTHGFWIKSIPPQGNLEMMYFELWQSSYDWKPDIRAYFHSGTAQLTTNWKWLFWTLAVFIWWSYSTCAPIREFRC